MKTTEILTSINAFMGQMRDGNTRELIANLQAALDYQTEKLRIYEEKYKAETGKDRPELTDDERRRLAKRGRAMNQYLLQNRIPPGATSASGTTLFTWDMRSPS